MEHQPTLELLTTARTVILSFGVEVALSNISIDVKFEPLSNFIIELQGKIEKLRQEFILEESAKLARDLIVQQAEPYTRTGRYLLSVGIGREQDSRIVGPGVEYAKFVERGSRPHEILPRYARALVFDVGGQTVFTRRVRHLGSTPRWVVAKAAEEFRIKVGSLLAQLGEELKR